MDIGAAIRLCRNRRKLTQAQLAQRAGLSVGYLSMLERNKRGPPLSTVQSIALSLGVPASVLVFLAAGPAERELLGTDVVEKLSFVALTILDEQEKQSSLL